MLRRETCTATESLPHWEKPLSSSQDISLGAGVSLQLTPRRPTPQTIGTGCLGDSQVVDGRWNKEWERNGGELRNREGWGRDGGTGQSLCRLITAQDCPHHNPDLSPSGARGCFCPRLASTVLYTSGLAPASQPRERPHRSAVLSLSHPGTVPVTAPNGPSGTLKLSSSQPRTGPFTCGAVPSIITQGSPITDQNCPVTVRDSPQPSPRLSLSPPTTGPPQSPGVPHS